MRVHPRIRLMAGLLVMAGAALLSTPGVRVATANENAKSDPTQVERFLAETSKAPAARAPSCDAARGGGSPEVAEQQAIAQMRARIVALSPPAYDPARQQDIVVLNNRGYNYAGGQPFAFGPGTLPKPPQ